LSRELQERQVPLIGVTAAFIFAAQMLNFTVAGGTSGHLLGGALAAILLGPWAGMLVLTSVLTVQALLFQDGGLLALGANLFNMAVVGVLLGWATYEGLKRVFGEKTWSTAVSGFVAAWLSVVVASLVAAVELAASGTYPAGVALAAMGAVHALIGLGEGGITVAVLLFLRATRPDLLTLRQAGSQA
jgi:cobalt/nickel transport system permease protein